MTRTGFGYRTEFLQHNSGPGHPERSSRLTAIVEAVKKAQETVPAQLELTPIAIEAASEEDLLRVHTAEHIDCIKRTCATGAPYPDPDTVMGEGSWEAALLAAGAGISAAKAVLDGTITNAFCAVRPPGHHAEPDRAMGFCLFNNVAVTARWLRHKAKLDRVAILDWDVHHGNGTQRVFYGDDSVYYASLHQYPHYPGTGHPQERGADNTNLNIPMNRRTPPEQWCEAIRDQVVPEFERFQPEFLLISCGFDAHRLDPLSMQLLEARHFSEMTRLVRDVAKGRLISLLEGGYHLDALAESAVAHLRALSGRDM